MEPFEACWHRIDRAEVHRQEAIRLWNEFIEDHPYTFALDYEGKGRFILRVRQLRPPPPELSVVTGEWFYNLRSALDYVIWATAVYVSGKLPPPDEGSLQYPIYGSAAGWEENLYRLNPLAQHHRDMLKQMQPYNSEDPDANYLGWLHRLARIDRHRRLSVLTAYLAEANPVIGLPKGCTATFQFGNRVLIDGEADIARIKLKPWKDDWQIKANPRIGIDPEIADWAKSPFWQRIPYNERFKMIHVFVMGEVALYEYDCTGGGRHADAVTEGFKVESDARRRPKKIVRRHVAGPKWGPPMPGKPSSEAAYEGLDDKFPYTGPATRA